MAVTYENTFSFILDKLENLVKEELPIPVQKVTLEEPLIKKGNESVRLIPNGTTLVSYGSHMEQREYSITIQYVFLDRRNQHKFLDHVMNQCSRLEALIHDNITITLGDTNSTRAFDLRMNEMEFDAEIEEEGFFIVEYDFTCQHIGNQA